MKTLKNILVAVGMILAGVAATAATVFFLIASFVVLVAFSGFFYGCAVYVLWFGANHMGWIAREVTFLDSWLVGSAISLLRSALSRAK